MRRIVFFPVVLLCAISSINANEHQKALTDSGLGNSAIESNGDASQVQQLGTAPSYAQVAALPPVRSAEQKESKTSQLSPAQIAAVATVAAAANSGTAQQVQESQVPLEGWGWWTGRMVVKVLTLGFLGQAPEVAASTETSSAAKANDVKTQKSTSDDDLTQTTIS